MSVMVNVMVFGDVMKHVAQELSEKGRSVLTSVILCVSAARCFFSSLKTADSSSGVYPRGKRVVH
jgi:hypothetical protein